MKDFTNNIRTTKDSVLLKKLFKYIMPHIKKFLLAMFLMIVMILADIIMPMMPGVVTELFGPNSTHSESTKMMMVLYMAIALVALVLVVMVVDFLLRMTLQRIGQKVLYDLRKDVFNHIESLSIGQINEMPVGKLVTRVTSDPNAIGDMFTNTLINMIKNIVYLITIMIVLLVINWQMALYVFALLPIIIVASVLFRKISKKTYRSMRNNVSELNAFLAENLSGMKIIQMFNQEEKKNREFLVKSNNLKKDHINMVLIFGIYRPIIYFLSILGTVLVIYVGTKQIIAGALVPGLFITFYLLVSNFFEPIQQMAEQFDTLQNAFASAEKVFDVLDTKASISDSDDSVELVDFKGHIEFRNVWFYYNENEWVLKGVNFEVKPNETVAFVGATGSGKSTILGLIVRNYEIQKGQILIDGIDIKKIKRSSLRANIGQMLQDVFLFSGTIKDNITLKNEEITDEEVIKACEYVGADKFIKGIKDGYNHEVLERGNNFSSGQRQLISFARAIVYKPVLMILDEATANIDSETENLIQESLSKMMSISTMLIVAHRLSTIQHSDKIIVMQKGEIIEFGNHQELLKQRGIYYKLYELQYDKKSEN